MIRSSFLKRLLAVPAVLLAVRQPEPETVGEIYPWPAAKNSNVPLAHFKSTLITDSNAWYIVTPAQVNNSGMFWRTTKRKL